jgi:phage virion morphogenesis protein
MPEIRIEMKDEAVKAALIGLSRKFSDLSPVMKIIGEYMVRSTENRFNRQGPAPDGSPWKPLAASTLKRKKHPKILTESGALRGDIHYHLLGTRGVAIGTSGRIPYAAIHQLGGTIAHKAWIGVLAFKKKGGFMSRSDAGKRKTAIRVAFAHYGEGQTKIPARPFLGVSADDSTKIVGMISQWIAGENKG